jgi:predicted solute-binding protein
MNCAPYFHCWDALAALSEGRWAPAVLAPRQLGQAAERGEVDAGIFAEADLARLEPEFQPLVAPDLGLPHGLGIANRDRVGSVLLFLRRSRASTVGDPGEEPAAAEIDPAAPDAPGRLLSPQAADQLPGARVAVTSESSTAARLLRILLEERHGIARITYVRGTDGATLESAGAALVIGDEALRWRQNAPAGFALAMDLATEWHRWTGLPFTFARWGVRASVPAESRTWLARFLEQSLREAAPMLASLESFRASPLLRGSEGMGTAAGLLGYLQLITYRLGPEEIAAAETFRERLRRRGLLDPAI